MWLTFRINFLLAFATSCSLTLANRFPTFNNNTIFQSPPNYTVPGTLYARTLELPDGSLLATWENYSPEPPLVYFPIYKSTDGAVTWHEISHVTDQVNVWGLRYQPFLYLLPEPIGELPANSILLAGNSIPTNLSHTQIDLYSSTDEGCTWKFISHIAAGGAAIPDNGIPAVWEPFLLLHNSELICFYSDQRDPEYGQKLVHQTTSDLVTWSEPVNDVTYLTYTARPGMAVVAQLPTGQWILTYENGGAPIPGVPAANYSFPAYYRISASPLTFDSAEGLPISTPDGTYPQSSPYCVWSPLGGLNGSIIVSTGTHSEVFVNQALGDVGAWQKLETEERVSYSRSLRLDYEGRRLLIAGGGLLPPSENNSVTIGSIDLGEALG
jgi:hypothetical protein